MGMNVLRDSPAHTWGSEGAREGGKEDGGKEGARRNINMQPSQDTLCVMYIKRGLAHANVQPRLVINMSLAIPRVTLLAFDWAPRRSFESREGGRGGEKKTTKQNKDVDGVYATRAGGRWAKRGQELRVSRFIDVWIAF